MADEIERLVQLDEMDSARHRDRASYLALTAAVIEALPQDFPGQLVESVMTAINERSHLLAVFNADAVPR